VNQVALSSRCVLGVQVNGHVPRSGELRFNGKHTNIKNTNVGKCWVEEGTAGSA
jgi:hypothetical protein